MLLRAAVEAEGDGACDALEESAAGVALVAITRVAHVPGAAPEPLGDFAPHPRTLAVEYARADLA